MMPLVHNRENEFRNYPGTLPIDAFHMRTDTAVLTIIAKFLANFELANTDLTGILNARFWVRVYFKKFILTCGRSRHNFNQRMAALPLSNLRKRIMACRDGTISSQYGISLGLSYIVHEDILFEIRCLTCKSSTRQDPSVKLSLCTQCLLPHCELHNHNDKHICNLPVKTGSDLPQNVAR